MSSVNKVQCSTEILEILISRVCHDLISPVGAIHNGLEFMRDMGDDAGDDALDLIAYSAQQAGAKLQLFRLAYGAGGADSAIKPEQIHKSFDELLTIDNKITQIWDPLSAIELTQLPTAFGKMLSCTMLSVIEGLPRGGTIQVIQDLASGEIIVIGKGKNAGFRDYVEEALENLLPVCDIDPRLVHSYVLGLFAKQYNYSVSLVSRENEVNVMFKAASGVNEDH